MKQQQRQTAPRRWRQRRLCILHADGSAPAVIRDISARGAFLETNARPELGARVRLEHAEAGTIEGEVSAAARDGIAISFHLDARAVGFALAAIAGDMSRPAA